jgi:predicted ATP-dependent protease
MDLESISTDKVVRLLNNALTMYKRELKSQYQKHLDCIESELRDWLDSGSSNLRAVNLDSTISSFMQARQFDGAQPEIDREAISNMIPTAARKAIDVENRLLRIEARLEQLEGMVSHHANIGEQTVSGTQSLLHIGTR